MVKRIFIAAVLIVASSVALAQLKTTEETNGSTTKQNLVVLETTTGNIIDLMAKPTDKIETVRELIQEKLGIPSEEQRLSFEGMELTDGWTLSDYNILKYSIINLRVSRDSTGVTGCEDLVEEICVTAYYHHPIVVVAFKPFDTRAPTIIHIIANPLETIQTVKSMLQAELPILSNVSFELRRFDVTKTLLEDKYTLSHYEVKNNEILIITTQQDLGNSNSTSPYGAIQIPINSTLHQYHTHLVV